MSVKTITIAEDAYQALAAMKERGESFSDVIRRLTRKNRSLLEFAGDWKDVPREAMREYLEFLRIGDEFSQARLDRVLSRDRE